MIETIHDTAVRLIVAMAPTDEASGADLAADLRLIDDLGYDSVRLMELTVVLERKFGLPRQLPEQLAGVHTVGDVIALVTAGANHNGLTP